MTLIALSFQAWERNRRPTEDDWLAFLAALAPMYSSLLGSIAGWPDHQLVVAEYYCERSMVGRLLSWFDEEEWWVESADGGPICAAKVRVQKSRVWDERSLSALTPMFRSYELPDRISFDGWAMPLVEEAAL